MGVRSGLVLLGFHRGEIIYEFERLPNGWIRVALSERGGTPEWMLDAASVEIAEVYVSVRNADVIRRGRGLGWITPRKTVARQAIVVTVDWAGPPVFPHPNGMKELQTDGTGVIRFGSWPRHPGMAPLPPEASYIDQPLDEVLSSLEDSSEGLYLSPSAPRRTEIGGSCHVSAALGTAGSAVEIGNLSLFRGGA